MKWVVLALLLPHYATALTISAKITGTTKEVATIQKVIPVVEKIINSEEFKQKILSSKFTYTKLSNEEIYKKLTESDWKLDLVFEKQGSWAPWKKSGCKSNVLGWTYRT